MYWSRPHHSAEEKSLPTKPLKDRLFTRVSWFLLAWPLDRTWGWQRSGCSLPLAARAPKVFVQGNQTQQLLRPPSLCCPQGAAGIYTERPKKEH